MSAGSAAADDDGSDVDLALVVVARGTFVADFSGEGVGQTREGGGRVFLFYQGVALDGSL